MSDFIRTSAFNLLRAKGFSHAQATKGGDAAAARYTQGGPFNGKALEVCMVAATQGLGKPKGKK